MKETPFSRFTALLLRRRLLAAMLVLPFFLVANAFIPKLAFDPGVESFMDRTGDLQKHLDEVQEKFVSDSWVLITYASADVFSKESLEASRELAAELKSIRIAREEDVAFKPIELGKAVMNGLPLLPDGDVPADQMMAPVEDVQALVTMDDAYGGDGVFRNALLVPEVLDGGKEQLEEIRRRAHVNPNFKEHFVGKDDRFAAMYVRLDHKLNDREEARVVTAIRQKLEEAKAGPGIDEIHVTGWPDVQWGITSMVMKDTMVMSPMMMGIAVLMIFFFLRRLWGVAVVMLIVNLVSPFGMASIPMIGATFHPLFSTLMPLLTVMCVATALHFFAEAGASRAGGADDQLVRRHTLGMVGGPSTMAILTTAIGFLALASSEIRAVKEYGLAMSLSLAVVAPISIGVIALVWSRFSVDKFVSPKGIAVSPLMTAFLDGIASIVVRRSGLILVGAVIVFAVMGYGMSLTKVGESQIGYFPEEHPTRVGATAFQENFGGVIPFLISIRTDDQERFHDPAELKKLEELERYLKEQTPVDRVLGIVPLVKMMHRAFFDEDDSYYRLPESREAVSQLLLLNSAERVWDYVDEHDRRWVRIYARMPVWNSGEQQAVFEDVRAYLRTNFPKEKGYDAHVVGDTVIVAHSSNKIARTVGTSFGISLLVILILFAVGFRSLTAALLALPANLFPVVVTFAVIGFFDFGLGVATSTIASIIMGIAVDDTIHFMSQYKKEIESGADPSDAVVGAIRRKGPAIVSTTVIFALGFSVFLLADFNGMRSMGGFLAIAVVAALVGDLLVLAALLRVTRVRLGA